MNYLIISLISFIAFEHFYFMWFEMFAWTTKGRKIFRQFPAELFEPTKALAANQGLYNGFLAAGLVWSLLIENHEWHFYVALFFLSCVSIGGIYGAFTASKKIFMVQALPALITIILLHIRCY
jgi:putative membrane protein